MDWDKWVLDASASNEKWLCFCPVEGDLNADYQILTGISTLSDSVPNGKLVGVIHSDGQEAVEAFCEKHRDLLDALKNRGGKMSEHVKTENESDTLEVQSVLWHEKHEQIKWQRARIAALEAQLAEARKDSERLEKVLRGHQVECGIAPDGRRYIDVAHRVGCYWIRKFISYGTTFSEAIDAAIEAAGKGSE